MVNYHEILRLRNFGYTKRQIASCLHCSRNTISEIYELSDLMRISWETHSSASNRDIYLLLYPEKENPELRKVPDCNLIHKELAKQGVTLTLLWSEYCEQARSEGLIPYQYTQFCDHYRYYVKKTKATMRIKRKPGELLEVDWAGTTLFITDQITGELIPAYVFVAALSCSQYSYAEAFPSMKTESWIQAHVNAYRYFQGVTRILVPDNLKTGVVKHGKTEVILNNTYQEMAEHYGTAVIPARPYSPKDKPNAEGAVGIISIWIIAALRNERFFSFAELNHAIKIKLDNFNQKPFQKKQGSRLSAFEEEEKSFLLPLPAHPYELSSWASATIQMDYLITVDKCQYSVPYEYIGQAVDIKYTDKTIEVFFKNTRIASHLRRSQANSPVILTEHMPENHKRYLSRNGDTYREWAESVGKNTLCFMEILLTSFKIEEQAYKSCGVLMKLADRYSLERIETACEKVFHYTPKPSIKMIQTFLKTGQDRLKISEKMQTENKGERYGFTRRKNEIGEK